MKLLLTGLAVLALQSAATQNSNRNQKRKKVGDIHLQDSFHPWDGKDDGEVPKIQLDAQHRIGEYMLQNLHDGDCLDTAINKLEAFSTSNHMGMTLGEEKGRIIEDAIISSIKPEENLVFLELGAHIGDGTLRMIRQLSRISSSGCVVFSLEANQQWLGIGTALVRHAFSVARQTACRHIPMTLTEDISHILDVIKNEFNVESFSGVFLDHNHAKFLRDINIMYEKELLREGTLVIADNALRHKNVMQTFISEMKNRGKNFRLADVSDPYPDQVLIAEWNVPKPKSRKHDSGEL